MIGTADTSAATRREVTTTARDDRYADIATPRRSDAPASSLPFATRPVMTWRPHNASFGDTATVALDVLRSASLSGELSIMGIDDSIDDDMLLAIMHDVIKPVEPWYYAAASSELREVSGVFAETPHEEVDTRRTPVTREYVGPEALGVDASWYLGEGVAALSADAWRHDATRPPEIRSAFAGNTLPSVHSWPLEQLGMGVAAPIDAWWLMVYSRTEPIDWHVSYSNTGSGAARPDDLDAALRGVVRPRLLERASSHAAIIAVVKLAGRSGVADRLVYLRGLDADDPGEPPMDLESLRAFAAFLLREPGLPDSEVGVNPAGLVQVEWDLPAGGLVAMEFLRGGMIRFAAAAGPLELGPARPRVSGTLPTDEALAELAPFISLLERA